MQTPFNAYQRTTIETASPEKLILMLYDGMIRFLGQAKIKIREKNIEESNLLLVKAQRIVSELTTSLNPAAGGDMAKNLASLYLYIHTRLVEANLGKDEAAVQEVMDLVVPLREAWAAAMSQQQNQAPQNPAIVQK